MGYLFKGDPSFDYIFHHLPKNLFMQIVNRRRKRLQQNPHISDIL